MTTDGAPLRSWTSLHDCRAYGGYVEHDDDQIKGLYYAPFAEYGLHTEVHPHLAAADLPGLLAGGHLVLLTGHDHSLIHLHNPSGHTPGARQASLPIVVFETFFGDRGIALSLSFNL